MKSIKSIRKDFKNNGVFYTPPNLAKALLKYIDISSVRKVYDPTCGCGNLLAVFPDEVLKYGQELDENELKEASKRLTNFVGYSGDTLENDKFKGEKFDCIIGNPPFSVSWNQVNDERFADCGVLAPKSKADYAFILHMLHHLDDNGVIVTLEFPGILYRGQSEGKIRKWLVEKNYIERVVHIPGNTFEDTSVATCILVLRKNKNTTDVVFENREIEKERIVPLSEIVNNGFNLSVSSYVYEDKTKEKVDINILNQQTRSLSFENIKKIISHDCMISSLENDHQGHIEFISKIKQWLENYIPNFDL